MKTRVYSAEDIRKIVHHVGLNRLMDDAIDGLTQGFRDFDPKLSTVPMRDGFEYSEPHTGLIEWMPAMRTGADVVIKMVGYHPSNPISRQVPTILSTILIFDTCTGHLLTILDGTFLTALRTGAASAVASRILARPDSKTLGLVGAGAQAVTQLHALSRVFDLEQVVVYDSNQFCANSFTERVTQLKLDNVSIVTDSLQNLVVAADLMCTATSVEIGNGPVFPDVGLKQSIHINAVGADFAGKFEVPHSLLARSLVCPDSLEQASIEGECQQLRRDQIGPNLVELVKNDQSYHSHRDKSSVFDSTGWALEDYIVAKILSGLGEELGFGSEIEFTQLSYDPRNPYAFLGGLEEDKPLASALYSLNEN